VSVRTVFFGLTLAAALVFVVSYVAIMAALDRMGYKTNFLLARIYTFKYMNAYKELTIKENGKPGPLYRVCILSITLALAFAIAAVLSPK
jgi:hypothetical protein